jgi:hypothetical protein
MSVDKVTEDFELVNIDKIALVVEDLILQLEHHANYFENRFFDVAESRWEISKKKLELEYCSYSKILKNLSKEVKQISEIVYQSKKETK